MERITLSDVILSEAEGSRRSRIYLKIERAALLLPRHSERKGHCPNKGNDLIALNDEVRLEARGIF